MCLLTGRFVPPIHRKNLYELQYSMLPLQRAGVGECWAVFFAAAGDGSGSPNYGSGSGGRNTNGSPNVSGNGHLLITGKWRKRRGWKARR